MPTTPRAAPTSRMAAAVPSSTSSTYWRRTSLSLCKQRLALGGVDQHGVGLGGELDVGRETGPAGPHHPRLPDVVNRNMRHGCLVPEAYASLQLFTGGEGHVSAVRHAVGCSGRATHAVSPPRVNTGGDYFLPRQLSQSGVM